MGYESHFIQGDQKDCSDKAPFEQTPGVRVRHGYLEEKHCRQQ